MNIYIPKGKEALLSALDHAAERARRPKNELVMEALERYLAETGHGGELGSFSLGTMRPAAREELYRDRLER